MQPPTAREARLESLVNERDIQLSDLHDEVTRLRSFVSSQPPPSSAIPLSLPPAVSPILLAQLATTPTPSSSNTVIAALTQRAQLLQEENEELYELLRYSETGKLKEEVRGLRRLVQRLQGALRQSHESINVLSRELDKSYESYLSATQSVASPQQSPRAYPPSPRASYAPAINNGSHGSKLPPTGPRAQKRPRLSEPNSQSFSHSGKSHSTSSHYNPNPPKRAADGHPKRSDKDARGGSDANKGNRPSKMDVDSERPAPFEPSRGREKDADREYDKSRDRDRVRNRERDRDRGPKDQDHSRDRDRGSNNNNRRSGNGPGRAGGRRGGDRPGGSAFHGSGNTSSNNAYNLNGDRTLAERMGL